MSIFNTTLGIASRRPELWGAFQSVHWDLPLDDDVPLIEALKQHQEKLIPTLRTSHLSRAGRWRLETNRFAGHLKTNSTT